MTVARRRSLLSAVPKRSVGVLSRATKHTIKLSVDFVDGPANDVAKVTIDGTLRATGGSWEDYYRFDPEQLDGGNKIPVVNRVIFRTAGAANPGNAGKGFLVDNLGTTSSPTPVANTGTTTTTTTTTPAPTGSKKVKCKKGKKLKKVKGKKKCVKKKKKK